MSATALAEEVDSILDRRLDAATDHLLFVNPDEETIARLVETLDEREDPPQVSLLAGERRLKTVFEEFLVASRAADLVEHDHLQLRSIDDPPNQSILVNDGLVTSLVPVANGVGTLGTDSEEFVEAANEYYSDRFEIADPYALRTPALSRVRETLEADIDTNVAADFDAVLDSLNRAIDDTTVLDEVTISILVAAYNGVLLYDISKWGEDVGLASKATFSRTKTTLEDAGLIETEKVPIKVGRPRLRLVFADERLTNADPVEMVTLARQMLPS